MRAFHMLQFCPHWMSIAWFIAWLIANACYVCFLFERKTDDCTAS